MLPNLDIPKDINLIPFPINPRYTKQGTLDGAIGMNEHGKVLDPDYRNAQGYGEYSYFKPREAYTLKRRIERDCIVRALTETGGNITRAAALLGMKRPRLSQLVKQYGLFSGASEEA